MAEILPLSKSEIVGLLEMRRLKAALVRRGDEHLLIAWRWHGKKLHSLKILDHSVLMEDDG